MTDLDRVLEGLREAVERARDVFRSLAENCADVLSMEVADEAAREMGDALTDAKAEAWHQPATGEREDVAARLESWSHDERLGDGALLQKAAALLRAPEPAWVNELLESLEDLVRQHCDASHVSDFGMYDSMALSADADAMRLLARAGRFVIDREHGRRVIGHFKEGV